MALHSDMQVTCLFHSPPFIYLALPAVTQFSEWQHSSFSSLSASLNGYRHRPSALHMCSFQGLQPNHFTCGLHPSSVDALVDIHDPSCNFPFLHSREALLVGHWVTALPSLYCGILFPSPPKEVVLHRVVHLSHVLQFPIHKGMPTSDMMRRSQFQWRTHNCPCWFITLQQGTSATICHNTSQVSSSHLSLIFLFPFQVSAFTSTRLPGFKFMAPIFLL